MGKRERRLTKRERGKQQTRMRPNSVARSRDERVWIDEYLELFSRFPHDAQATEAARLLKFRNLPPSVFKFTKVSDNHLENLEKGQVWMSSPSDMNDPFDATFRYSAQELFRPLINQEFVKLLEAGQTDELQLTAEQWARIRAADRPVEEFVRIGLEKSGETADAEKLVDAASMFTDRFLGERIDALSAGVQAHYMVSCFCERVDSPLLWGHYAANHHGMCVEYPIRGAVSDSDVQSRLLFPVIYSEKRFDATSRLASAFRSDPTSAMSLGILSAIHKFSEWAYEREWRLVDPGALMAPGPARMPSPRAVYCGMRLADPDRARVLKAAATVGAPVYQMVPDRETFRMKVVGPIQASDGTPRPMPKDVWELAAERMRASMGQATAGPSLD